MRRARSYSSTALRAVLLALLAWSSAGLCDQTAEAQLLRGRLRRLEPQIEAIAGKPYGVGRWTVQLPPGVNPALLADNTFTLGDTGGRASFQAFQAEPLRTVARELLGRPQMVTVYFLFKGEQPLDLALYTPTAVTATVTPRSDPVGHARLLSDWWVRYARQSNRIDRPADYPDVLDNYLLSTLARRLSLPAASQVPSPPIRTLADSILGSVTGSSATWPGAETGDDQLDEQMGLLFGTDSFRSAMQSQVLQRRNEPLEPLDQALPAGPTSSGNVPDVAGDIPIEPIAMRVPPECFYLRFGTFSNYLWYRDTMARWSGDLKNLFNRRGLDPDISGRFERQLSLKESALAELLGPTVIADVAMIGSDFFFREGAAFGMLFQARNNLGLHSDFAQQRAATLQREQGCTEQQVDIAGHQVSLLSTPDNRVRSFYAIDGDYHFVTNSRHLVARFFEVAGDKKSLGATREFRLARSQAPVERGDTMFGYLSTEFLRNLAGPHYQIEMFRRMRSVAEIDMALVARLAARGENQKSDSIEELIAADYLPEGFGQRADGSRLEIVGDEFVDSVRGARGSFLPVLDVKVGQVTASEARRYGQFLNWFQTKWTELDPVVIGIRREQGPSPDVERIALDLQLTPMAVKNYETLATALGPISKQHLAHVPGDVLSVEVVFSGNLLASKRLAPPQGIYRFFGGVRDADPSVEVLGGSETSPSGITINGSPLPGGLGLAGPSLLLPPYYFGAYPTPAIFQWFGVEQVPLDQGGYGRASSGLWERRDGRFTTASPSREVLETVTPQLRFVDAARPGQAWLHAGDLSQSKLASTVNNLFYRAAKSAAAGNVRFLHSLNAQLRVPPDDCLRVAEQLTDSHFVCPLGGQYELVKNDGAQPTWVSTGLSVDRMRLIDDLLEPAPTTYTAPLLQWLRGADADLSLGQRTLSVHGDVEMQRSADSGAVPAGAAPKVTNRAGPGSAVKRNNSAPPPRPGGEELPVPPR